MKERALAWLWVSGLVVLLDQVSKYMVSHQLTYEKPVHVLPFLNFVLRFNSGAAFSFLGQASGWQVYLLSGISIVASILLVLWLYRLRYSEWMIALPVALILGGAVGNLIDRMRFGHVIDFVDFHVGLWHFATFNVADAAVTIGAVGFILRLVYESFARKS